MKYIPLQPQPCKLHEIQTLTGTTLEIYIKYIPLHENNPVNYMKCISLQGQTWKLHEIQTLTETTLEFI